MCRQSCVLRCGTLCAQDVVTVLGLAAVWHGVLAVCCFMYVLQTL